MATHLAEWFVPDGRGDLVAHRLVQVDPEPVITHPRSEKPKSEPRRGDYIVERLVPDAMGEPAWRHFYAWSPSLADPAHACLTALANLAKESA